MDFADIFLMSVITLKLNPGHHHDEDKFIFLS